MDHPFFVRCFQSFRDLRTDLESLLHPERTFPESFGQRPARY